MTNSITINIDNNSRGFYYPNETISGTVEVKINLEDIKVRCVKINLKGKEYCKIPSGKNSVVGSNKFLNFPTILHGSKNDTIELTKGTHSYGFALQLPAQIPYSVEGSRGHIRYKLEAIVDIPWALDLQYVLAFTVLRHEDLRAFPELGVPCERELIKKYYTFLCRTMLLKIIARLPKLGYALGESVSLNVEMINNSTTPVNFTTVTLKRVDKFMAGSKSLTEKTTILESRCSGVDANDTVSFELFFPLSPDLMITNDRYSENYTISYEIRLRAETGTCQIIIQMPNSLTITFNNNPDGIYYPNQVVSGSVELRVVETIKKARGLRLIVDGEAECKWTVSSGTGSNRRSTTYRGEEKYLNSVTYLFGSKEMESAEVAAGIHTYNFMCQLPTPIPYSVEGKHGHIRYKVDVNLDIPWAFDLQAEKAFTIVRYEDLNYFPELRMPCEFEEMKTFCCLFCKSEPLILKLRLPKTGFALGETIPISVEMINKSSTDVLHTTFTLKRVDKFNSQSPSEKTNIVKEEMVESRREGVRGGATKSFEELLQIPEVLMVSNDRYCKVFQVTYELKFTAETEGMSVSPDIHIPITIGSVALRNENFPASAPPDSSIGLMLNDLPPSFEAATRLNSFP